MVVNSSNLLANMGILFLLQILTLVLGSALIYAGYKDWRMFYKLPGLSAMVKHLGKKPSRFAVFVLGSLLVTLSLNWLLF